MKPKNLTLWVSVAITAPLLFSTTQASILKARPPTEFPSSHLVSATLHGQAMQINRALARLSSSALTDYGTESITHELLPAASPCIRCEEILHTEEALLTVGYALSDGGSVAMWLEKDGGRVRGQRYTADGLPQGNKFLIDLSGNEGLLPIVIAQPNGGFTLRWNRRESDRVQTLEQHYGADGMPIGNFTQSGNHF